MWEGREKVSEKMRQVKGYWDPLMGWPGTYGKTRPKPS